MNDCHNTPLTTRNASTLAPGTQHVNQTEPQPQQWRACWHGKYVLHCHRTMTVAIYLTVWDSEASRACLQKKLNKYGGHDGVACMSSSDSIVAMLITRPFASLSPLRALLVQLPSSSSLLTVAVPRHHIPLQHWRSPASSLPLNLSRRSAKLIRASSVTGRSPALICCANLPFLNDAHSSGLLVDSLIFRFLLATT